MNYRSLLASVGDHSCLSRTVCEPTIVVRVRDAHALQPRQAAQHCVHSSRACSCGCQDRFSPSPQPRVVRPPVSRVLRHRSSSPRTTPRCKFFLDGDFSDDSTVWKTTVETDRYVTDFRECQALTTIWTTLVELEVRFVVRKTPKLPWFESARDSFVDSDESITELQRGVGELNCNMAWIFTTA